MAVCRSRSRARLEARAALLAVAALVWACHCASATNYTVGDDYGWQRPPATDPTYFDEWSAKYTFHDTDRIRFDSHGANTNVVQIGATAYAECDTSDPTGQNTSPTPVTYSLAGADPGDYYFASGIAGDCEAGLKVTITISVSSGGDTPEPPPAASGPPAAFNDFYVGLDAPGTDGWTWSSDNPTFYQDWADSVAPLYTDTDILVFDYYSSLHNVVQLDATAYSTCDTSNPIATFDTGGDRLRYSEAGVYYFSSSISDDCGNSYMRFSIQYLAGSRPTDDTPSPPTISPPTESAPPVLPPPPPTSLPPPVARNPPPAGVTAPAPPGSTLPPVLRAPPTRLAPNNAATSGARVGCLLPLAALGLSLLLLT